MSTGSSVTAPRIDTATTTIAPIAIDRIVVESTRNSPASEMIAVTPEKTTASPEVRREVRRGSGGGGAGGVGAGADLLPVAGEHEQRVVHGHADADHRGHVGHEHRHVGCLGEEEDG